MKEILRTIYEGTAEYYGTAGFLVLEVFAGLLLMLIDRKKYSRIIIPSVIILIIVVNPISYKLLLYKTRLWRLFWMVPLVYIMLLAFMELLKKTDEFWKKLLITAGLILLLTIFGDNTYLNSGEGRADSVYKLPNGVIEVSDIMLEKDKSPRCVLGGDLLTAIRLYSGDIEPMYGRNAENYMDKASEYEKRIFKEMESETPNYTYVLSSARRLGYNFIVNTEDKPIDTETERLYGYSLLDNTNGYNIYYNPSIPEEMTKDYEWNSNGTGWYCMDKDGNRLKSTTCEIDGVWYYFNRNGYLIESVDSEEAKNLTEDDVIITQIGVDDSDSPSMCYTIDDMKGHFIIVDGGSEEGYKKIYDEIKLYGRHVDAWILTHPHEDHTGAFNYIYKTFVKEASEGKNDYHKVKIDKIYAVDIDRDYFHKVARKWDDAETFDKFYDLMENEDKVEYVKRGETYKAGDLDFKVYNTFTDESYDIKTGSLPNASCMVFELFGKDQSMLFLGDLEQENADLIEELYGDELKADVVQAAHHGQNLYTDIYDLIDASTVFVDAPEYLRYEISGTHTAYEHIKYFKQHMKVKTYETAPNSIVLR
ncbi:MAG: MBL fold metallo-hydrolase [Eubacterium sp.]|nr:MBL fold metallo-hydrolase [Eubacterium sp.]